jgi:DNA helicase-2/ATP-dependent DNA helicase PcrA
MTPELEKALDDLSPIQREAVDWQEGSALVLAGPGAGKTRVLTSRIARILDDSRGKNFRVLALTFTTKAANEMAERIEAIVPGLTERVFVGTFHAFCANTLQLHGSHVGIKPDFGIYDQDSDRIELLAEAVAAASDPDLPSSLDPGRWIKVIDRLKSGLVTVERTAARFTDAESGKVAAKIYQIYEAALRERNALDFNGLILETCRLAHTMPAVANRIRQTYPFWLIDEFQDTSPAQSRMIKMLAGDSFRNIYAVADDDQIIYQWAGASYRQIELFRENYSPTLIQLVENHRCPAEVVAAANRLVAHNTQRTPDKTPIVAARASAPGCIEVASFPTDLDERQAVAARILAAGPDTWGRTVVLARTRQTLEATLAELRAQAVTSVLAKRRDRFVSPQFAWLSALLEQTVRPTDRLAFKVLVDAANRFGAIALDPGILMAEAEVSGRTYLEQWSLAAGASDSPLASRLQGWADQLVQNRGAWRGVVRDAIPALLNTEQSGGGTSSDAQEDRAAWDSCMREIRAERGGDPELAEVVQGMSLRSKEPPHDPAAVALMTVHGAKGLEFDFVYVVGLAESLLPSWQSIEKGDASPEMEEERRNCFVAITRTKQTLHLSWADRYGTWRKNPSRFLNEMGLV